ncbi:MULTISPECIES: hypothetical protein [Cysteiniphilum]|nr:MULTISPECIES: hypothetical protein [Cysteiniphilum]
MKLYNRVKVWLCLIVSITVFAWVWGIKQSLLNISTWLFREVILSYWWLITVILLAIIIYGVRLFQKKQVVDEFIGGQAFIKRFNKILESHQPFVCALTGLVGVGKTHFIKNHMAYKKDKWIYISLFGVATVNELQTEIIAADYQQKSWLSKLLYYIKLLPQVRSYGKLWEEIYYQTNIQDRVIVFDDLERFTQRTNEDTASDSLNLFMGLVEKLRQSNCQIFIILDDTKSKTYANYLDKVIDRHIRLKRSIDNIDFAFDHTDLEEGYKKAIRKYIGSLEIKNVRIIFKITQLFVDLFSKILNDFDEETNDEFIKLFTLYAYCYYSEHDDSVPSLDYIFEGYQQDQANYVFHSVANRTSQQQEEVQWIDQRFFEFLQQYQYHVLPHQERTLLNLLRKAVEDGYIEDESYLKECIKGDVEYSIKQTEINSLQEKIKSYFFCNFDITEEMLIKKCEEFIRLSVDFQNQFSQLPSYAIAQVDELLSHLALVDSVQCQEISEQLIKQLVDFYENNLSVCPPTPMGSIKSQELKKALEGSSEKYWQTNKKPLTQLINESITTQGRIFELASFRLYKEYDYITLFSSDSVICDVEFSRVLGCVNDQATNFFNATIKPALEKVAKKNPLNEAKVKNLLKHIESPNDAFNIPKPNFRNMTS